MSEHMGIDWEALSNAVGTIRPDWRVHPSETLKDWMTENRVSRYDLVQRSGLIAPMVARLVSGEVGISPRIALKLETGTGVPAEFWLRLQLVYDLDGLRGKKDMREVTT